MLRLRGAMTYSELLDLDGAIYADIVALLKEEQTK